jgi:hypothetical protein
MDIITRATPSPLLHNNRYIFAVLPIAEQY